MQNNIKFIVVLVAICIAIFGIFYLIFPTVSAMMGWCSFTGILLTIVMGCNIHMVSTHRGITIKNAAIIRVLNLSAGMLFVWTLIYVFLCGSYVDISRTLSGMYIGYLLIFIVGIILWFMADRGGTLAQAHSDAVQADIQGRDVYLTQLRQVKLNLESLNIAGDNTLLTSLGQNVDLLRCVPSSKFNSPAICQQLSEAIMQLDNAVDTADLEAVEKANRKLTLIINSIKI